jgi:hypothetical protein
MCLERIKGGAKIAKRDIVCYKLVVRGNDGIVTYYQHSPICIGDTYHSEIEYSAEFHVIEKALHSFRKKEDAVKRMKCDTYLVPTVIECIIPKGSTYYTGKYISAIGWLDSYASDCIKYIKILEECV